MNWTQLHGAVTWTGLIEVALIVALAFGLLLAWAWPRHEDGSRMSLDEIKNEQGQSEGKSELPAEMSGKLKRLIMMVLLAVLMLAVALSKHALPDRDARPDYD